MNWHNFWLLLNGGEKPEDIIKTLTEEQVLSLIQSIEVTTQKGSPARGYLPSLERRLDELAYVHG